MSELKLNIGCGTSHMDGFINIDIKELPGVDKVLDATKGLPFPDNSVDYIVMHDFLEHIHKDKFISVIKELYRISKKGAGWNIRVPYWSANSAHDAIGHYTTFTENTFNAFNPDARGKGSTWTLPDPDNPGKELDVWLNQKSLHFNYYGHVRDLLGNNPEEWDKKRKFYTNVVDTLSMEYEVVKF